MPRKTNTKIWKEKLILCEGRDEQEFLIGYLNSRALSDVPGFSNDFQVIDFGGNSELVQRLAILKNMSDFEKVTSLLVIRDAESDASAAVREIQSALEKTCFPVPQGPHEWKGETLKTGFVLFPFCDENARDGTLEDLCLSILSDSLAEDTLKEIRLFLDRLENRCHKSLPRRFKTELHTYFSVHDKYVSLKIGEAAAAGAFNWNHKALKPLRDFLQDIL